MIDWNKRNGGFLSPESVYEDQLGNLSMQINNLQQQLDKYKNVIDKIKEKDIMYYDPEYSKIYGELCNMPGANNTRTPVIVVDDEILELFEEVE